MRVSLDGNWLFRSDPRNAGTSEGWFGAGFDRSDWREVRVPGSWEDYPEMQQYDGHGWFARSFEVREQDPPLSIYFGGVDDDATVWINGIEAGSHEGHDEPFIIPLAGKAGPGRNLLVIRVLDHGGGGGVYGHVTLTTPENAGMLARGEFADIPSRPSAEWVRDAVIYEVYLRSFSREGSFRALEQRLPELRALGATVLWLMPIHPVGELRRKGTLGSPYAIADYYGINQEFGTIEDFRALVRSTHHNGMKIIIDLVANHTAWDNPLITAEPSWYTTDSSGVIVPPNSDWTDVADLNYDDRRLRDWMIAMMEFWVRDVGIDGFRCDVAELVPTGFWEEARARLDAIKPVMMLSEGSLPEHHRSAFDITYSWNLYNAMGPMLSGEKNPDLLDRIFESERNRFPEGSLRLRFNTNHDKNAWDEPAVLKFGMKGLELTTVLAHTFPGIPLIYTGEEVANDRRLDLFEKIDVDWTRRNGVRLLLTRLGELRRKNRALTEGAFERIPTPEASSCYLFLRQADQEIVLVALNFSPESAECWFTAPSVLPEGTVLQDLSSGDLVTFRRERGQVRLGPLAGHGWQVLSGKTAD